jgi:hypothetical protein
MIEVFTDIEQNSQEWLQLRLGIPTASKFSAILAQGKDGSKDSKTRRKYLLDLLGERLTGEPAHTFSNDHTERGHAVEPEARDLYEFITEHELTRVGFVRNGDVGASPDSLIGNDGMLEGKSRLPRLQAELLLADRVPTTHMAQLQGQLWVAEREWVDFMSYCKKMPPFIKRVYRDESYIKQLETAVRIFNDELNTMQAVLSGKQLKVA